MPRRIHKQREKRHVENNRLGVQQSDSAGLAEILAGLDVQYWRMAGFGKQHLGTEPGQVRSTQPLHGIKSRRVRRQQRRHTGHRQPHQHLVPRDDAQRGSQPAPHAALAGGGDQGQVARAGDQQKDDDGDDKCAIVCNAKHENPPGCEGPSLRHNNSPPGFAAALAPPLQGATPAAWRSQFRGVCWKVLRAPHTAGSSYGMGRFNQTMQRSASNAGTCSCST